MSEHHHTAEDLMPPRLRRFGPVLAAAILGIVLIGYLSGVTEQHEEPGLATELVEADHPAVPEAVPYQDLPSAGYGANGRTLHPLVLLRQDTPSMLAPVVRTEAMKQAALADRTQNRAFDAAPPTVPHPILGLTDTACMTCHGKGIMVGDAIASRMSHQLLPNCTQCHVEKTRSGLPWDTQPIPNDFQGVMRAGPGIRTYAGAPPTIPHATWMRTDCLSCHGVVARPGLRTTHPYLTNCRQCHVASAEQNQLPFELDQIGSREAKP